MKRFFAGALILCLAPLGGLADELNALIGDRGFESTFGHPPEGGTDETLRIRSHLDYVADLLQGTRPNRIMTAGQWSARRKAISLLRDYAATGRFPHNADFPAQRRPYFIDDHGTLCAAGHLVAETAGRSLAETINQKYRNALVMDMQGLPALEAWIHKQGLTLREVAMIQPTYRWRPQPPIAPWPSPVVQGQWRLINASGEVLATIQATRALPFSDGRAAIKTNGKWGFIDQKGEVVIAQQYKSAQPFSDGLAVVEPLGVIDTEGKPIKIPKDIEELSPFINGLSAALSKGKWGFINKEGNWAVPPKFKDVGLFEGELAAAQNGKGWGYIDAQGKMVIKPRKDIQEAGAFHKETARVKTDQWRLLNRSGEFVGQAWEAMGEFDGGYAPVKNKQGMGVIDHLGKIVIPPDWNMIGEFSEGLAPAQKHDWERVGYINPQGKFVIGEQFNEAAPFKDGVASVRKESNWGCIDPKGDYVHQPRLTQRVIFSEGRAFLPVFMQVPRPQPIPQPFPRPVPQPQPKPGDPGPV